MLHICVSSVQSYESGNKKLSTDSNEQDVIGAVYGVFLSSCRSFSCRRCPQRISLLSGAPPGVTTQDGSPKILVNPMQQISTQAGIEIPILKFDGVSAAAAPVTSRTPRPSIRTPRTYRPSLAPLTQRALITEATESSRISIETGRDSGVKRVVAIVPANFASGDAVSLDDLTDRGAPRNRSSLNIYIKPGGDVKVKRDGASGTLGFRGGRKAENKALVQCARSAYADVLHRAGEPVPLGFVASRQHVSPRAVNGWTLLLRIEKYVALLRISAARLLTHPVFDNGIIVLVVWSCIELALDSPALKTCSLRLPSDASSQRCFNLRTGLRITDIIVTVAFAFEMAAQILVRGLWGGPEAYLGSTWRVLDGFVVGLSIASSVVSQSSALAFVRMLRASRALRPLRLMARFPHLRLVINAMLIALPASRGIFAVCILIILIFGIVGVQVIF